MPIAYACPHCGKQFSVADQYAGQTGPCANCNKPITIPASAAGPGYSYAPQAAAKSGGGGATIAVVIVGVLALMCICPGILAALLLPAIQSARTAARRAQSTNNMKQIALALHNYHDTHGAFPPAIVTDSQGNPLYSGRVLLLPFLEQGSMYSQFDLSEPWDSDKNQAISLSPLTIFQDPASPSSTETPAQTDYLFVSGPQTMFEGEKGFAMQACTDGTSNTLMVVEVRDSGISWAEPKDWDSTTPLPASNHPSGNLAGYVDGSVRLLPKSTAPQILRGLSTRNGGESVSPP